jgi:hypothetical protein
MDVATDWIRFGVLGQDLAKMSPLFVEGPWRCILDDRGCVVERLPGERRQAG